MLCCDGFVVLLFAFVFVDCALLWLCVLLHLCFCGLLLDLMIDDFLFGWLFDFVLIATDTFYLIVIILSFHVVCWILL